MVESLSNTVALVTGASSGLGHATALNLAKNGAKVVLVARRADRLEELAEKIRADGGTAKAVPADITTYEDAENVVKQTISTYGRLDTVVNAAGFMNNGPMTDIPIADWDLMIDVNVKGLMYITRAAIPYLLEAVKTSHRKVADVVNISSLAGRYAAANNSIYNATKFAVNGATEAWRQEFAKRSVRFSLVEPGAAESEIWNHRENQWKVFTDRCGVIDLLHAEDVADSVSFIVTSPRRVSINEIVVRPTDQI